MPVYQITSFKMENCIYSQKWNKYITTNREFLLFLKECAGYSENILDWVDYKTRRNNFSLEQKIKFLKDSYENSINAKRILDQFETIYRNLIGGHITKYHIKTHDFINEIQDKSMVVKLIKNKKNYVNVNINDVMECLTFFQMYFFIYEHWKSIGDKPGFVFYFWEKKECRDKNLFLRELKILKNYRNLIAHSKGLLEKNDLLRIQRIFNRWNFLEKL